MKKIRWICLLLLAATALLSLTSCGNMDKDSLYFLNFKPEVASVYDEIAAKYMEETGVRLRVVTAASGTYEQTLKSEIGKTDAPVLFQINGPTGYAAWKNYCADLSKTEIYQHLTDKSLCITDGKGVYGIPYVVEGYGILYNGAITDRYFALKERGTDFSSMEQINSFPKLKALVEDMSAHKAELGIDGVFASTSLKSGEDWRWHSHLANVPVYYEFLDNKVDLTKPGTYRRVQLKYGGNFKDIFDLYINNSVTTPKLLGSRQVSDSMAEFALGKCAMVQNGNWAYGQISGVSGNTVKAKDLHFLPIYTGISGESEQGLCIGTENYLAINKNASPEKQKQAADFLLWLYTSENGKKFVTEKLGFIPPFDSFTDVSASGVLAGEIMNWMNREDVFNIPWVFQVFPSLNFKNAVGASLLQYAQGSITWERVEEIFRTKWAEETGAHTPTPAETLPESERTTDGTERPSMISDESETGGIGGMISDLVSEMQGSTGSAESSAPDPVSSLFSGLR